METTINTIHDPLLNILFSFYRSHDYKNIYKYIHYISLKDHIKNKYLFNGILDTYVNSHSKKHLQKLLCIFYKTIIIYKSIIYHKYHKKTLLIKKNLINNENLYGESIKDCKETIIYIKCDKENSSNPCKHKYYAFTYSELNKIITHSLLFMNYDSAIIETKYPQNPWTNKKFTITQLEYILYKFRYHSLHHHKIIDMFADSQFSISKLIENYDHYLYILSTRIYIKQLTKSKFIKLFNKMWLFVSSEYTFFKKTFHDKYPRLPRIVCKRCIMNIPDFQKTFTSFVVTFYNNYFKTVMFTDDDIIDAIKFKYSFVMFLEEHCPYVFKNNSYYHLHNNKYKILKKTKKPFFTNIQLPIVGFTDDCKIIYNSNGNRCILQGQILVTI